MKTYRFVISFGSYVDIQATTERKARAYFRKEYAHLGNWEAIWRV